MGYQKNIKDACILIDELIKKGHTEPEITNMIQLRYGFGRLMVKKRIALLEELGTITVDNGKITIN